MLEAQPTPQTRLPEASDITGREDVGMVRLQVTVDKHSIIDHADQLVVLPTPRCREALLGPGDRCHDRTQRVGIGERTQTGDLPAVHRIASGDLGELAGLGAWHIWHSHDQGRNVPR